MEYFSQKGMEAALQQLADKISSNERGSFNAMLAPQLVSADYENRSCTLCFTQPGQGGPRGHSMLCGRFGHGLFEPVLCTGYRQRHHPHR